MAFAGRALRARLKRIAEVITVQITVELPNDLAEHPDPGREAIEALAIAGYKSGKLTSFQAGRLLGFGSRFEFDAFLKQKNILEHSYSAEDLKADVETLRKLDQNRKDHRPA